MYKTHILKGQYPTLNRDQERQLGNIAKSHNKLVDAIPCFFSIGNGEKQDGYVISAQDYADTFGDPKDSCVNRYTRHIILSNREGYQFSESSNRLPMSFVEEIYKTRTPGGFDGYYGYNFQINWKNNVSENFCLPMHECVELYKFDYPMSDIVSIEKFYYKTPVNISIHMSVIILYGEYKIVTRERF